MPRWDVVTDNSMILAVHAALLHTGHILYFGGNQFNSHAHQSWVDTGELRFIDNTRLYNCATGEITNPGSPPSDLFCCGHAFLASGDLLVAGGTERWVLSDTAPDPHSGHWPGLRDASIFSAQRHEWLRAEPMLTEPGNRNPDEAERGGGRWYPTLLTLANGRVIALSGHPSHRDNRHNNNIPEIYDPIRNHWVLSAENAIQANNLNLGDGNALFGSERERVIAFYPRAFVLPDGDVFCADPQYHNADVELRNRLRHNSLRFQTDRAVPATLLPPPLAPYNTNFGNTGARFTSVLLPLLPESSYRARIMACGADDSHLIDLSAPSRWLPTGARRLAGQRLHANAVLLPTGNVFICGGVAPGETGVMIAELYDPVADRWENLEPATVRRGYHSVALLMPDGRIWTAGYSINGASDGEFERRIEIYTPWYCERSRPTISWVPTDIRYGAEFDAYIPQAERIQKVALLRAGSCTHAFNSDQRYVGVEFTHVTPTHLSITAPPNGGVAPPGRYLLFIIDQDGVPSEGKFVHLDQPQPLWVIPSTRCVSSARITSVVFIEVQLEYPPLLSNVHFRCDVTAEGIDLHRPLEVNPRPARLIGASAFCEVTLPPDLTGTVRVTAVTNNPSRSSSTEFFVSGPGLPPCRDPLEAEINVYEVIRIGCEAWDCGWTGINDVADLIGRSGGMAVRYLTALRMIDPVGQRVGEKAVLRAINNRGRVIGVVNRSKGQVDGFVCDEPVANGRSAPEVHWVPGVSFTAINDAGVAVGNKFIKGRTVPVRWAKGQVDRIEMPSKNALALAIDGAENIAGTHIPKGDEAVHAFIMDQKGFRDLGDLGGSVIGLSMNGGNAIAGTVVSKQMVHGFAYSPQTGLFDLKMPIDASQSIASGVNNMGMIVGTFWSNKEGIRRAFRFTMDRGTEDLNAFISPDRMVVLETAVAVNNRGQILTSGSEKGEPGFFLLSPASIPIPHVP